MKKKYTMEEFKEMFKNAKTKVLEEIMKDKDIASKNDPIFLMTITMTTMLGLSKLEEILFKENEDE